MKQLRAFYWWLFNVYLSFKWIFRVHLGCRVWYGGKKYLVLNGTRLYSWRLDRLENGDEGWVREEECKKVWSLENMYHSFWMGYRFYMRSWFSIWKDQGIQPWMRACKIWLPMSHDVETIEDTLAYKLGMMHAYKMVLEALSSRAMAHNTVPNIAHATECLLIANEVIKPLWIDASREASGLNVAALENQA